MGRVRRGGYIITWFAGDHRPRHVHVQTDDGQLLGRFDLETRRTMEDWQPTRKLLQVIADLEREGRI
jgi:hypothetical protein